MGEIFFLTGKLKCRILCLCTTVLSTTLSKVIYGFPGGSDGKESTSNAGDLGSIPGSGRYPGEGNGNSLQYSCLENSMERGPWWATVHGVTESDMTEQLTFSLSNLYTLRGLPWWLRQ